MKYQVNKIINGKGKILCKDAALDFNKYSTNILSCFNENNVCIESLHKPELFCMSSTGLYFSGFKHTGYNKKGVSKFVYEEWYCSYL